MLVLPTIVFIHNRDKFCDDPVFWYVVYCILRYILFSTLENREWVCLCVGMQIAPENTRQVYTNI